jgi:hypothetical protein
VSRGALRKEHRVVDVHVAAGVRRKHAQQASHPLGEVLALDQIAHDDRARVDHRVERAVRRFIEQDGVERLAGWLDADSRQDAFQAVVLKRQSVGKRFRHRLDREQLTRIAHFEGAAFGRHHRDAEPVGIGLGQLGNVVSDAALAHLSILVVNRAERLTKRRRGRLHLAQKLVQIVFRALVH